MAGRYEIQEGDTLASIAKKNGLTVRELLDLNPRLADNPRAVAGQLLFLRDREPEGTFGAEIGGGPGESTSFTPGQNTDATFGPPPMGGTPTNIDPNNGQNSGNRDPAETHPGIAWQDPAFLAFMRQFGFETSQIRSDRKAAIERLRAQYARNQPMYDEQIRRSTEGTNYDFAGRGMYFSGGRNRVNTENTAQINRNRLMEKQGMQDNIADIRRNAASEISEWQRNRAEERLAARERQTNLALEQATGQA